MAVALTLDEGPALCGVRRGEACIFHPPDHRLVGLREGHVVVDDGPQRGGVAVLMRGPRGLVHGARALVAGDEIVVGEHRFVVDEFEHPPPLTPRLFGRVRLLQLVRIGPGPRGPHIAVWDACGDDGVIVTATVGVDGTLITGPRVSGLPITRLLDGGRVDDERAAAIAAAGATYLLGTRLRLNFDGVVCADWTSAAPVGRRQASRGGLFAVLSGQALDPVIAGATVSTLANHVALDDLAALARGIAPEAWAFEEQLRDEAAFL